MTQLTAKVDGRRRKPAAAKLAAVPMREPRPGAIRIEMRSLAQLVPYARNARKHSDAQVRMIAASIREFGFNNPVLVDASSGIIAGHGRVLAAAQLGMAEVPVIPLEHMSENERRAYILADNRLAELATWDEDLLAAELASLQASDLDVSLTGFIGKDLDRLLDRIRTGGSMDGEDDAPPAPAVPTSRPGDLWLLGPHRLICGDSTLPANVSRVLGGAVPLLMVTDPPYGVEYDPSWRTRAGVGSAGAALGKVQNDDRADWRAAWALFPGDVAYIWHGALHATEVDVSLRAAGFEVRSQIIWVKSRPVLSRGHYHWQHEPAFFAERIANADPAELGRIAAGGRLADSVPVGGEGGEGGSWVYDHELAAYVVRVGRTGHWHGGRKQSTVWTIDHLKSETGHGTQKPVECMRRPIINNSSPGQAVYDPFLGSGTTLIAAETVQRVCYGCELDTKYVDVIVKRWQDLVGAEAILEGDGRSFAAIAAERGVPAAA